MALPRDDMWDGEPIWYKEPATVLSEKSVGNIRAWHAMLLDVAKDFRQSLQIKAGICKCPAGYEMKGDISIIDINVVPERWAAELSILKRMCEK